MKKQKWKTWNITYKKKTNRQIPKNDKDNIYANINSYINEENIMKYSIILLISGQKWCHPNADEHDSEVTKKRVDYSRDTKESKKYGCICTCCHANDLPWYNCVIFWRNNYNLNVHAVANALWKRHREIRQKEFICKPCHKQLKDGKYSNNVQNCLNCDMFGWCATGSGYGTSTLHLTPGRPTKSKEMCIIDFSSTRRDNLFTKQVMDAKGDNKKLYKTDGTPIWG